MIHFVWRLGRDVREWLVSRGFGFNRRQRLTVTRTDQLPEQLSRRHLYVVGERGEDWFAAMACPCGCGALIDLNLLPPGRPCWTLTIHRNGSPTLSPSVWRQTGCRAHFYINEGRLYWVKLSGNL